MLPQFSTFAQGRGLVSARALLSVWQTQDTVASRWISHKHSRGNMSVKHLTVGDSLPPKVEGKLRVYNMRFCPYAQRVLLALNVKGVPYDIVNVNLKHKPEWLFKLHPAGKVPALDTGDEVVIESLDIADFINEKYPNPPLYPADPERKAKDKELIEKFGKVISAIGKAMFNKEKQPIATLMQEVLGHLEGFETELASRGTTFFGGDKPGMVDLMIWPWIERFRVSSILAKEEFQFPKEKFPKMVNWTVTIRELKPIKDTIHAAEAHAKFLQTYFTQENPEFDIKV